MPPEIKKQQETLLTRKDTEQLYYWMGVIRLIGIFLIGSSIALLLRFHIIDFDPRPIIFFVLPAYLFITFLVWIISRRQKFTSRILLYLIILSDLTAITASIYFSGGQHIEFAFLYIIVIIPATLFSAWITFGTSALSLLAFIAFTVSHNLDFSAVFSEPRYGFDNSEIVHLAIFLMILAIIAFQSYMYVARIKKASVDFVRLKDEFLFRTVHDLRSPLSTIRFILEKYSKPEFIEKYPEVIDDIGKIRELNSEVLKLINDLLTIAKGENAEFFSGKVQVNLTKVIFALLAEYKIRIEAKKLRVEYAPGADIPEVMADPQYIKEIFENLIDNAVKYNKDGGTISISHSVERGFIKTRVKDSGMGISPDYMKKLFSPYFRAGAGSGTPGTGLGLYIVKTLAEKMNGKVEANSILGEGSEFDVFLPAAKAVSK